MDWQQIASLAIVAAAALWLIRTQILAPRRGGGCGGCGGCGSAPAPADRSRAAGGGSAQLVQIELDLGTPKKGTQGSRAGQG